jgi:hypothetical protein
MSIEIDYHYPMKAERHTGSVQMKRWFQYGLALAIALLFLAPSHALAYSYGDANTEAVAETFKLIDASLSDSSPDWKTAEEAYKVIRTELSAHFGDAVVTALDKNFKEKDAKLTIANFKAVLVMNMDRRFQYALDDLNDYAAAKLLLAKAKATYETLEPYMTSGTGEIKKAFEDALTALGNPGLFGVGKTDANPEAFKKNVTFIQEQISPLFPFQGIRPPGQEGSQPTVPVDPSTGHAPMERTQKTNTSVTIGLIIFLLVVGGLIFWWMKRRK